MDEVYVTNELGKMGLDKFYSNIMRMLNVWFEDAPADEVTDFAAETIFGRGAFGTHEEIQKAVALRAANKTGSEYTAKYLRCFKILFPSRTAMQPRYPILKKRPYLLPILWPVRWVSGILFRRENIRKQREIVQQTSSEVIQDYRRALEFVGLNYTIKD